MVELGTIGIALVAILFGCKSLYVIWEYSELKRKNSKKKGLPKTYLELLKRFPFYSHLFMLWTIFVLGVSTLGVVPVLVFGVIGLMQLWEYSKLKKPKNKTYLVFFKSLNIIVQICTIVLGLGLLVIIYIIGIQIIVPQ